MNHYVPPSKLHILPSYIRNIQSNRQAHVDIRVELQEANFSRRRQLAEQNASFPISELVYAVILVAGDEKTSLGNAICKNMTAGQAATYVLSTLYELRDSFAEEGIWPTINGRDSLPTKESTGKTKDSSQLLNAYYNAARVL